ncbi:hypothetical protein EDD28_0073 [Salana multivorans]|uniref:Tail assembly chaperone n=1 Tax=Salana multivorans TaxID=120377 RepID=A0A3N2D6W4_9MICO|nr:phage tail assembly protein [Salana multivorans]ROR95517.1 hypothetical protein EDD28_0073 [Salana multivorans]
MKITFDDLTKKADEAFPPLEIELEGLGALRLEHPLALDDEGRATLSAALSALLPGEAADDDSDEAEGDAADQDEVELFYAFIKAATEDEAQVDHLRSLVGRRTTVLAAIVNFYVETVNPGEASASQS